MSESQSPSGAAPVADRRIVGAAGSSRAGKGGRLAACSSGSRALSLSGDETSVGLRGPHGRKHAKRIFEFLALVD